MLRNRAKRAGGRLASYGLTEQDDATRADMQAYTGCIAGALTQGDFEDALAAAGLGEVEIRETHRSHAQAASAIVRARKPSAT